MGINTYLDMVTVSLIHVKHHTYNYQNERIFQTLALFSTKFFTKFLLYLFSNKKILMEKQMKSELPYQI